MTHARPANEMLESSARRALVPLLAQMRAQANGARHGRDPEDLHQLRVALRRLRVVLRVLGCGLGKALQRHALRESAWLSGCLGATRDFDVTLARLAPRIRADAGGGAGRAARVIAEALTDERRSRRAVLEAALDSDRYLGFMRALEGFARGGAVHASGDEVRLARALGRALGRMLERLLELGRPLRRARPSDALDPSELHALRSRARRLRYALELASELSGKRGRRLAARLVRLQEVFGEHQDAIVATQLLRHCRSEPAIASSPDVAQALQRWIAIEQRKAAAARARCYQAWQDFVRSRPRARLGVLVRRMRARAKRHESNEGREMTCMLFLVRHAIAEVRSGSGQDRDRRLTREGSAKMRRAALGLKRLGIEPDLVLSSPLRRAKQTAELLCRVLAPELRVSPCPELAPEGSPEAVLAALPSRTRAQRVFLVGHEPDLGRLAALLLTGSPERPALVFKKGGTAAIEIASLPPRERGRLHWFLTPRQLRALA